MAAKLCERIKLTCLFRLIKEQSNYSIGEKQKEKQGGESYNKERLYIKINLKKRTKHYLLVITLNDNRINSSINFYLMDKYACKEYL